MPKTDAAALQIENNLHTHCVDVLLYIQYSTPAFRNGVRTNCLTDKMHAQKHTAFMGGEDVRASALDAGLIAGGSFGWEVRGLDGVDDS